MRSSTVLTAALAALAHALPCSTESCTLTDIPSPVVCGGNGYVAATNTPWYRKSQEEGTIEKCIDACQGGCKAVSWDTQYKTCYFYTADVTKMKLYGTSSFHYFDRACTFDSKPADICGGNGYVAATNTPWYRKSQEEGTMKKCLDTCRGGCKAVSFDTQYKTCYFYTAEVTKMKLYGKSSFHYFDRSCGFENAEQVVCGLAGSADDNVEPNWYDSKVITSGAKDKCLAWCREDDECKAVRYHASSKTCFKYEVAVKDVEVTFEAGKPDVFYDQRCYECTSSTVQAV
ncbi:hypothetical protein QQX98_000398 [Neonectria punicea]|uniref:Apple domain-containing protein n=1 Tax=Neonectria punicea TaxID=979145 RepID=A0ABR1HT69_9HYPO